MSWNNNKKGDVQLRRYENSEIINTTVIESDESVDDALMYIFNYTKGFAIISATKGVFPVLAYSEDGFFDENEDGNLGPSIWLNYMKDCIAKNMTDTAVDIEVLTMYDSFIAMIEEPKDNVDLRALQYFDEIRNYKKVGPLLTTEWDQDDPCNRKAPMIGGVRAPAGCVPVAIGQVVNYHKTLTGGNINWNGISNNNGDSIADLIYKISDHVQMKYTEDYAHPKINVPDFFDYRDRVKNYLNARGYNVSYVELGSQKPSVCPAIYEGFTANFIGTTNWFGGHWWVMDGYESYDVYKGWAEVPLKSGKQEPLTSYSVLMLHFNWGWGGGKNTKNGWYGVSGSYLDYSKNFRRLDIRKK